MQEDMIRFGALIDRIYQGALHPEIWPAVLQEIAAWMGVSKATLFTPTLALQDGGFTFDHNLTRESAELYSIKFQKEDLWVSKALEKRLAFQGNVILDSDLLPEAELFASSFYQDFLVLNDMARVLSGIIFDLESADIPCIICAMYRGREDSPFTELDRLRFQLVLPHLSRALGVMFRLQKADLLVAASLAALDQINSGILLVSENGEVIFANQVARRILEDEDGLYLKRRVGSRHWRLLANDNQTQATIDAAIRSVTRLDVVDITHFSHSVAIRRPSGRIPFGLQFSALHADNEFGSETDTARGIVFLTDATTPISVNSDSLVRFLDLTPSEARLATAMLEGISLQEAASRFGVSLNTVKTQLQQIYQKTEVDSRAKLVKLLISLAA